MIKTLFAALLLAACGFVQAVVLIDDFAEPSGPDQVLFHASPSLSVGDTLFSEAPGGGAATSILGGSRDIAIEVTDLANPASFNSASVSVNSSASNLSVNNNSGVATEVRITWDGLDGSDNVDASTGLLGVDLTESGVNSGILLSVLNIDLSVDAELIVWSSDTDFSTLSKTYSAAGAGIFGFSSFATHGDATGAADFANVSAIQLVLTGPQAYDAVLDFIQASVPVPSTALTLLTGLWFIRRTSSRV